MNVRRIDHLSPLDPLGFEVFLRVHPRPTHHGDGELFPHLRELGCAKNRINISIEFVYDRVRHTGAGR